VYKSKHFKLKNIPDYPSKYEPRRAIYHHDQKTTKS
jgi:hypothetical protein